MSNKLTTVEPFAPGEYIQEELDARGWNQLDLAEILDVTPPFVNRLITGARPITTNSARGLADAFGTSAQLWLNLESAYQLARVSAEDESVRLVARRSELYALAPIREMQKRGWLEETRSIDVLEAQLRQFFGIQSLEDQIQFKHAARKSTDYREVTPGQLAWLHRVKNLATALPTESRYSNPRFKRVLAEIEPLRAEPEELRKVSQVLSKYGIRFLVVEHLPSTKIDGVTFWLDKYSPVIALSLRYDRIDWFWHTLMHELAHVKNRDGVEFPTVDTSLVGSDAQKREDKTDPERRADEFATSFTVDQRELDNFIARIHPLYSSDKIVAFAKRIGTHPGMVVGQLQHNGKISYAHSRGMLVKVRKIVISSALTDGWGHSVSL